MIASSDPARVQAMATVLTGVAMFFLARAIAFAFRSEEHAREREWRYDVARMEALRKTSFIYRTFFPVIRILARVNRVLFSGNLARVQRDIQLAGSSHNWTADEYLACQQLCVLLCSPCVLWLCTQLMGLSGLITGVFLTLAAALLLRMNLAARARARLNDIKRRLPFLLDLVTLLMEAGATFLQALDEAATEFRNQAIGEEFGRVLAEMQLGKSRAEALSNLQDRCNDNEIESIVGAILQGETLGTPLAAILRTQADVLRVKRSQRAELLAGEAGVKMLLPGILVMAATVLIILGPFVIGFLYSDFL